MVKGKQPKFCKICISSIESGVYNKKKIQMFGVNHSKHLNILYILSSGICSVLQAQEINGSNVNKIP